MDINFYFFISDIDECAFPHLSGCSHSCQNTKGSYMCTCPEGMWIGSDDKTCRGKHLQLPFILTLHLG